MGSDLQAATLRAFVHDGRLVRLPEKEVDVVLRAWCAGGATDYVSLRRHLVDEGLLTRADGVYWRSGGWVDVLG
jgi:hypothetical protein